MGKKSGPAPPPAPDPRAVAAAQAKANAETARLQHRLNAVDVYSPYGSSTFTDLGGDRWRQNISLSPEQQALYDAEQGVYLRGANVAGNLLDQASNSLSSPFSLDALGGPVLPDDYSADRRRVEDAMFARLEPQLGQDYRRLQQDLANQGIQLGNTAYSSAMDDYSRAANDARIGTILAGGQEQSRMFRDALTGRQQRINEALTERTQPLNEVSALLGLGQVTPPPAPAAPQTGVANTDVAGITAAAHAANMQNYQIQQQQRANSKGIMGNLAGTALRFALPGVGNLFGGK